MIFAVAAAVNDWWERRVAGNPQGFQGAAELLPFDAQPPRGRRPHPPAPGPVGVAGDTLASLDNLIGMGGDGSGHWKSGMSAGLRPELEQVRQSAAGELRELHDEIRSLRAELSAALARADAAEARACSGACGGGG